MSENLLVKGILNKNLKKKFFIVVLTLFVLSYLLLAANLIFAAVERYDSLNRMHSYHSYQNINNAFGYEKQLGYYVLNAKVVKLSSDMGDYVRIDSDGYNLFYCYDNFYEYLKVGKRALESYYAEEFYLSDRIFGISYSDDTKQFFSGLIYYHWVTLFFALILLYVYLGCSKCKIEITDNKLQGKAFWGKKVFLPLNNLSKYSTSKFLSCLIIETSGNKTKFYFIENLKEITDVLSSTIGQNTLNNNKNETNENNLEILIKLKELLDNGVISQEEFDEKKKKLLNL